MLLSMTTAEPSLGASTAAFGRRRREGAARPYAALDAVSRTLGCMLGWALGCVIAGLLWSSAAQAQVIDDPSQPYLRPPPRQKGFSGTPPSAALLPDSQAPAPYTDREGTDRREETVPEPGEDPDRLPPVTATRTEPVPTRRPTRATQEGTDFRPPPRPQPAREPSGRSATVVPPFAVRVDPLSVLLEGKLGIEAEVRLSKGFTLEFIPIFQINSSPLAWDLLAFNFRPSGISRASNGIGPLAGAAIGVGVWFSGRPFRGAVLRAQLTNVGFEYASTVNGEVIDSAVFTERRLALSLGRVYRLGPIVLELSAGLRYELSGSERCQLIPGGGGFRASDSDCDGSFLIATTTGGGGGPTELFGGMGPFALTGRLSLGFAID